MPLWLKEWLRDREWDKRRWQTLRALNGCRTPAQLDWVIAQHIHDMWMYHNMTIYELNNERTWVQENAVAIYVDNMGSV